MVELVAIPHASVQAALAQLSPSINEFARGSGGRLLFDDIVNALMVRDMQLWAAYEGQEIIGAMLTEVVNHKRQRDAHMIAATGHNADRWLGLMPQIEAWAKDSACAVLKATCRPGWKKLLGPIGFDHTHSVLEKRL